MKYERLCKHCGKTFKTNYHNKIYCTPVCRVTDYASDEMTKHCTVCGKEFTTTQSKRLYCSEKCKKTGTRLNEMLKRQLDPDFGKRQYAKWKDYQREYRIKHRDRLREYYKKWNEQRRELDA
jgi:endogenous inhibitor of DNA gyrase (YacG/DUF329 family)